MSTLRFATLIPVLLLAACGSRQSSQPAAQAIAEPAAQLPASQPADAQAPIAPAQTPAMPQQQAAGSSFGQAAPLPPITVEEPLHQGEARVREAAAPYDRAPGAPPAREAERRLVTLPAGTTVHVRLEETLDTRRNRSGERFMATLYEPIVVNGEVAVPRGTRFTGHVVESVPSGRFKGRAVMSLSLDAFQLHGRSYGITTSRFGERSGRHRRRNFAFIGGGSGFGAAVGAIAAGPAGALIGAGAGAAAGTTGAALTGKKQVHIPVEARLAFALQSPVELSR